MPNIEFIRPTDQPTGRLRLQSLLLECLRSGRYDKFLFVTAFANVGTFLRMNDALMTFNTGGGVIESIFGIDHKGTSQQVLDYALKNFNKVYVCKHPSWAITFHPKMYFFIGQEQSELFIGSSNATTGGFETNFESMVHISYVLPSERKEWEKAFDCWSNLVSHPNTIALNSSIMGELIESGILADEGMLQSVIGSAIKSVNTKKVLSIFPSTKMKASSTLPKEKLKRLTKVAVKKKVVVKKSAVKEVLEETLIPEALAIQIIPHHNGEIFLSKIALNQHPLFFDFPFKGRTTPKIKGNPPYPQRVPDPIVDFIIYEDSGNPDIDRSLTAFPLNMVYYTTKGDIRITIAPSIASSIPPYSILLMSRSLSNPAIDYSCEIYPPKCPQYDELAKMCDTRMPSGGKDIPRKFGWL